MNCSRCNAILPDELAEKARVMGEIFNESVSFECDVCKKRLYARFKRLRHALTCLTCWEYHNLQFVNVKWFLCPTCQINAQKYWDGDSAAEYVDDVLCNCCRFTLKFYPQFAVASTIQFFRVLKAISE